MQNKKRFSARSMTQFSLLLAIEILLGVIPQAGMIMIPPVAITTLHIPVIICAVVMGPLYGGILGGAFGCISLIKSITAGASAGDLLFNPAASGKPLASLIMCIVPRILLGVFAALLFKALKKPLKRDALSTGIAAALATMLHTLMVLGCLWLFFAAVPLRQVLTAIFTLNGGLEILAAVLVCVPVCRALLKTRRDPK